MKILIILAVIIIEILIYKLPYFFPDTFTHNNPYDDDSDSPGGDFL